MDEFLNDHLKKFWGRFLGKIQNEFLEECRNKKLKKISESTPGGNTNATPGRLFEWTFQKHPMEFLMHFSVGSPGRTSKGAAVESLDAFFEGTSTEVSKGPPWKISWWNSEVNPERYFA